MRKIYVLISLLFLSLSANSQSVVGVVLDKKTSQPIPYASVYVIEIQTGDITDSIGKFELTNLPSSQINLQISSVGYRTLNIRVHPVQKTITTFYLEPSHIALEEVVISAAVSDIQSENVINVESRTLTSISTTSPITLAEAISQIPGVNQITTASGIGKPVIRGLTGNRVVVYAQGIRIENQQWGAEHGLGVGEVGVEKVEVIKGPASLLYGADALGGVLYFIDERYTSPNQIKGFLSSSFNSNTLGSINSAGFKLNKNGVKLNIFGNYSTHADYQIPNGDRVFNSRFNQKNIKARLGYNYKNWVTNIGYSYLENSFGLVEGDSIYSKSTNRELQLPFQNISNHNLSWDNTIYLKQSKINLIIGHTTNQRMVFHKTPTEPEISMTLNTTTYNLKYHKSDSNQRFQLTIGSQGMAQTNTNNANRAVIPNAQTYDIGGFVVTGYTFNDIKIQGGLRYDNRQIISDEQTHGTKKFDAYQNYFNSFNFSLGGVLTKKEHVFRINASSGFRAPNTSELLSYGVHDGAQQFLQGDTNLVSEHALQFDLEYTLNTHHVSFSINPFVNFIDNYIYLNPIDSTVSQVQVYLYDQKNAVLYGGETGIHFHPHGVHWLHINSNLSVVYGQDYSQNALPLIPATRLATDIKVMLDYGNKLKLKTLFLEHTYKFKQIYTGLFETPTPDYSVFNIGLTAEFVTKNNPIEINAGVKNLLNNTYFDHLSRLKPMGIPNPGVNFYIGIRVPFSKGLRK